jgi:hypothetical protein
MIETMKDAARMALFAQQACNLSGVVHSWASVQKVLCAEANRLGKGTEWRNSHPINRLILVQLAHLAGVPTDMSGLDFSACFDEVEKIAEETYR